MKRLRILFSIPLLILALPVWRYMDMISWLWPNAIFYSIVFYFWTFIFIAIPIHLLNPRIKSRFVVISLIPFSLLNWYLTPLSSMATINPELNHCGTFTYTGMFYPLRSLSSSAHQDDLEIRNQFCWIKKMIQKTPNKFENQIEIQTYLKITQDKLLRPEFKYRASLPLLALLHGLILSKYQEGHLIFEDISSGQFFVESLDFWKDQYTVEISSKDYPFWNWPHSTYIKYEYGLIEKNWINIVDTLKE